MPTVDASRSLLAAGANYNAGDWASVGAETSLEFLAAANLNRGVDIGLGVEALARLDGAIRQYIAADVNGQAHAAARVRAGGGVESRRVETCLLKPSTDAAHYLGTSTSKKWSGRLDSN